MDEPLTFGDITRAAQDGDPQLGELLVRYLAQDDPPPGAPEPGEPPPPSAADASADDDLDVDGEPDEDAGDDDDDVDAPEVPSGAPTRDWLASAVAPYAMRGKTATERKLARRDAWAAVLASRWAPPRLKLGALLLELYKGGDRGARAALMHAFKHGRLAWGSWQAAKSIYKLAEAAHDAEMFGVLAYRFDVLADSAYRKDEIGLGTVIYMRRRAWRWLRQLGQAVPDAYPEVAVEVLRQYGKRTGHDASWVAAHIWNRKGLIGVGKGAHFAPPSSLDSRAFPEAWKRSPAPLLKLLAESENFLVADFAIRSLRADHAAALATLDVAWLIRLGRRPLELGAPQKLVIELLRERPDLHMARLRELGLHDVVIGFLGSPMPEVRTYAIEYARAHAPDLDVATLVELATGNNPDVAAFAADRLTQLTPAAIGLRSLIRLLAGEKTFSLASAKLKEGFQPSDLDAELFATLATGNNRQSQFVYAWYGDRNVKIPAGHWIAALRDPRCDWQTRKKALEELGKRAAAEIGVAWIKQALDDRALADAVGRWLEDGMLRGDDLDVEWVKELVTKPRLRPLALKLLGNRALVAPARIGLGWLLDLARSADQELHGFAHRFLLEHFAPEDFAGGEGGREAGVTRLWELAAGAKSPEPVRAFAQTYLKAHHPELGPHLAEAKALGIKPRLTPADYLASRVVPLLEDGRADVRRLAATIASEELPRWGQPALVYQMAASTYREPRTAGCEILLAAAGVGGDGERKLPADWPAADDGPRLFALAESPHKVTRETAVTIIRRLYEKVGGAARLAWLMESSERDVRLFAVRLFWDRHRPRATPPGWTPKKDVGAVVARDPLPSGDDEIAALRQFLRTVLYGLPPGRLEKRDPVGGKGAPMPERPLPASVAKRRLVSAIRDLAVEEVGFAAVVAPVLVEFAASAATGEWQACVSALATLRTVHPGLGSLGLASTKSVERPSRPAGRGAR